MRYTVKLILGYAEDIKSTDSLEEAMNIAHEYCSKYKFQEGELKVRVVVSDNTQKEFLPTTYMCIKEKQENEK